MVFRAALAVGLLIAGFFALTVGVCLGLFVLAAIVIGHSSHAGLQLGALAVVVAVAMFGAIRAALRAKPTPHGFVLDRADQPVLWSEIDQLARIADTRPPDEIRVVAEVNAAVWEEPKLFGLRSGRRYLEVGLPLLAGLTVGELRSVLAHELGHYGHGHTKLSAMTYRAKVTLAGTVARIGNPMIRWLFTGYAKLYAMVSASLTRRQELEADVASVTAAGRQAATAALRKVGPLSVLWSAYSENYLSLAPLAGRTPDVLLGFRDFLGHPKQRSTMPEIAARMLDEQPKSIFDSHPPAGERIAAMERLPDTPTRPDERPGFALLRDPARTVPALEAELLVDGLGSRAPWPELIQLAGTRQSTRMAGVLARAGIESGQAPRPTLGALLDALGRGAGPALAAPLLNPALAEADKPTAIREIQCELFGNLVAAALVQAGALRFAVNWGGPWTPLLSDGTEFTPAEFVARAVDDPRSVPGLRQWLGKAGVSMDFAVEVTAAAEPDLVGLLPKVKYQNKWHDLLVYDTGLLLVKLVADHSIKTSAMKQYGGEKQVEQRRIAALVNVGLDDLRSRPTSYWLDTDDIAAAKATKRTLGITLGIQLRDGTRFEIRTTTETDAVGPAHEAIGELLGARLQFE